MSAAVKVGGAKSEKKASAGHWPPSSNRSSIFRLASEPYPRSGIF
jgi:hypothetical protein